MFQRTFESDIGLGGVVRKTSPIATIFIFTLSASCGGGGGGGTSATATPVAPTPTATISASASNAVKGDPLTLTWSSTNATSCTASGAWSGSLSTSGTQTVTASTSGSITYGISCTGGGGSASAESKVAVVEKAALSLSASSPQTTVGQPITLTWTTSSVSTCTASGAWSGSKSTNGTESFTPSAGGQLTFSLSCTGAGGSTSQSVGLVVPIPVAKSSYENKVQAGKILGPQPIPLDWIPCPRQGCTPGPASAAVFADFLRNGTYQLITHTIEYNAVNPLDFDRLGHIKFYELVNGAWVDKTSKIFPTTDNSGCLHGGKAIVADFLNNGRPSVFFSCYGFDAPTNTGEQQRMLLAQSDGTFKNIQVMMPTPCQCHAASAADINGDGYPDVIVVDYYQKIPVFFLINNKDGTFTPDYTRLPQSTKNKAVFTVELISFLNNGKYDVFLAGVEQCCSGVQQGATIYLNDGSGVFMGKTPITLPPVNGWGLVLDIVYEKENIYLNRTIDASTNFYGGALIQKINYQTLNSQTLFSTTDAFPDHPTKSKWLNWIIPFQNNIVSFDSVYKLNLPQ